MMQFDSNIRTVLPEEMQKSYSHMYTAQLIIRMDQSIRISCIIDTHSMLVEDTVCRGIPFM